MGYIILFDVKLAEYRAKLINKLLSQLQGHLKPSGMILAEIDKTHVLYPTLKSSKASGPK